MHWPSNASAAEGSTDVVAVNAASYTGPLAPGAIAAAFGVNLATTTSLASNVPLPTEISGSSARLIDSQNVERRSSSSSSSSGQINFLIPDDACARLGTACHQARGRHNIRAASIEIAQASPAIFTVFSNG